MEDFDVMPNSWMVAKLPTRLNDCIQTMKAKTAEQNIKGEPHLIISPNCLPFIVYI